MSSELPEKLILKKQGQIMLEDVSHLALCKPRLIPLKSFTLEKLEKMQQQAKDVQEDSQQSNSAKA